MPPPHVCLSVCLSVSVRRLPLAYLGWLFESATSALPAPAEMVFTAKELIAAITVCLHLCMYVCMSGCEEKERPALDGMACVWRG